MSGGTIQVTPSAFQSGAAVPAQGAGTTENLTNTLMTALNTFLGDLSPLAGEPIIGPGATALMEAVDTAGAGLQTALGCFGTGLNIMAPAMMEVASEFEARDASLANTFHELEGLLPQVESYATSVTLMKPTAAEVAGLSQYLSLARQGKTPQIQTTVTTLNISTPSPHRGFWGSVGHAFATAWDDTGGKAVHWVSTHGWETAAWTGAVLVAVGGAIINIPDGETGEVAILAGDGAMIDAATAADAASAATTAATTTTTATAGSELTYAQFLAEAAGTTAPADVVPGATLSASDLAELEALANNGSLVSAGG